MPTLSNFRFPERWFFFNFDNTALKRSFKINFYVSERHRWAVVGWRRNTSLKTFFLVVLTVKLKGYHSWKRPQTFEEIPIKRNSGGHARYFMYIFWKIFILTLWIYSCTSQWRLFFIKRVLIRTKIPHKNCAFSILSSETILLIFSMLCLRELRVLSLKSSKKVCSFTFPFFFF